MSESTGCSIVLVHHLEKSSEGTKLMHRALGSVGYMGVVRSQLALGKRSTGTIPLTISRKV
jgi:RecA-family ATPase